MNGFSDENRCNHNDPDNNYGRGSNAHNRKSVRKQCEDNIRRAFLDINAAQSAFQTIQQQIEREGNSSCDLGDDRFKEWLENKIFQMEYYARMADTNHIKVARLILPKDKVLKFVNSYLMPFVYMAGCMFNQHSTRNLLKLLLDKKVRTGLLQGSLLAPHLYAPNAHETSLELLTSNAGRYCWYDFQRWEKLGKYPAGKGKLIISLPEELILAEKNELTPTGNIDLLDLECILRFDTPGIDDCIKLELIEKKTYKEAYEKMGKYHAFCKFMEVNGIAEDSVYQVTPKGNGVVYILPDGGDRRKAPKKHDALKPCFDYQQ